MTPTLDRVTDRIRSHRPPALRRQVARARLADGSPIPLLDDLLGAWPDLRVNIDAKDDRAVGPLLDVLGTHPGARVCVGAPSPTPASGTCAEPCRPGTATALAPREVAALRLRATRTAGRRRLLSTDARACQVPPGSAG